MNKKRLFKKFTKDSAMFKRVNNAITHGAIVVTKTGLHLYRRTDKIHV